MLFEVYKLDLWIREAPGPGQKERVDRELENRWERQSQLY